MALSVNDAFELFLSRLIPTQAQVNAGAIHRAEVKTALKDALTVRNFFETGSFSNGTGIRGKSDIDVLVSLGDSQPENSYTALNWVKTALEKRFPHTPISISRPAVVVKFASGLETWEIIPGFLTSKGGPQQFVYQIPGANPSAGWLESAPKEHLSYVNSCNISPHIGDAKDLARLIKAWKYYNDVPISSYYLEMRCAYHVSKQLNYIHIWDVCQVLEELNKLQLAAMNDPSGLTGRIYACSSTAKAEEALSKLNTASTRARKALDANNDGDYVTAFYYLDLLFGGKFPAR